MEEGETDKKMSEDILQTGIELFSKTSNSKEEAFLKGYLMGLGVVDHNPNWELMKEHPGVAVKIERDISDTHKEVRDKNIEEAKAKLREIYIEEDRGLPEWLEKQKTEQ